MTNKQEEQKLKDGFVAITGCWENHKGDQCIEIDCAVEACKDLLKANNDKIAKTLKGYVLDLRSLPQTQGLKSKIERLNAVITEIEDGEI